MDSENRRHEYYNDSLEELRRVIRSPNGKDAGCAGEALARHIWDGSYDEDTVLTLLQDGHEHVRSTAAWAVSDVRRPAVGVAWLCTHGLRDSCELVRRYSMLTIRMTNYFSQECFLTVSAIAANGEHDERATATALLEYWRDSRSEYRID